MQNFQLPSKVKNRPPTVHRFISPRTQRIACLSYLGHWTFYIGHFLFNASSINSHATVSNGGATALVHLLNYSMRPSGSPLTLAVRKRYRQARLWTLGSIGAAALEMTVEADWLEMALPRFSVYSAVELLA